MKESELKASLERAEAAYEELVRTRASLGSMLAEAIRRHGGLPEFRRRIQDLPILIRSADIRRTALKVELLGRRLEEARRAYALAVNAEQRSSVEVQRIEELHNGERGRLERLRSETEQQEEVA